MDPNRTSKLSRQSRVNRGDRGVELFVDEGRRLPRLVVSSMWKPWDNSEVETYGFYGGFELELKWLAYFMENLNLKWMTIWVPLFSGNILYRTVRNLETGSTYFLSNSHPVDTFLSFDSFLGVH